MIGVTPLKNRFRWLVEVRATLAAAPDAVWSVLSTPGHLMLFHPFVESNPVKCWSGQNARDFVHYNSGLVLERTVIHWDEAGFDLLVGQPGGSQLPVKWRLQQHGADATELAICIELNAYQKLPWPLWVLPFYGYIRPTVRTYLNHVLRGLDFYLRTGQKVVPNQFGRHRIFSGKK